MRINYEHIQLTCYQVPLPSCGTFGAVVRATVGEQRNWKRCGENSNLGYHFINIQDSAEVTPGPGLLFCDKS